MDRTPRPKRPAPDEVPLRAISGSEVRRMFDACRTVRELLCLSTVAYLGSRRGAAARLRWGDVDLAEGWATLREKGAKIHAVALPDPYLALLARAGRCRSCEPKSPSVRRPDGATSTSQRRPGRSRGLADCQAWERRRACSTSSPTPFVMPSQSASLNSIPARSKRCSECSATRGWRRRSGTSERWIRSGS
jgi:integrase